MVNLISDSIFNQGQSRSNLYNLLKISHLIIERKYLQYV